MTKKKKKKKKEDNNSMVGKGSRSNGGAINPRDMVTESNYM